MDTTTRGRRGTGHAAGAARRPPAGGAGAARSAPAARLAQLRREASELQERAAHLEATGDSLERRLARLVARPGGARSAEAAQLRLAAQETLALLDETVRRRDAVRARIAQAERVTAEPDAPRAARTAPQVAAAPPMAAAPSPAPEAPLHAPETAPPTPAPPQPQATTERRRVAPVRPVNRPQPTSISPALRRAIERAAQARENAGAVVAPAPSSPTAPRAAAPALPAPPVQPAPPAQVAPTAPTAPPARATVPAGPDTSREALERTIAHALAETPPAPPQLAAAAEVESPAAQPVARQDAVIAPSEPTPSPRTSRRELERLSPDLGAGLRRWAGARRVRPAATALLSALLVVLALLLTPLPELFGWQLFAVQSGSMEPAIPVGSIIAVRPAPASELRVGDVITFADRNRPDVRVTHRIIALETREGRQVALTKGDANNTSDSWDVPVQSAIGRVAFHLPHAGYVVYWLNSPPVRTLALIAVVLLLVGPALTGRRRTGGPARPLAPPTHDELEQEIEALLVGTGIEREPRTAAHGRSGRATAQV